MNEFELIAKTFMGLEPVLAKELTQLGANNVEIGRRMVSFTGDKEMMYRANFQLHTVFRGVEPYIHALAAIGTFLSDFLRLRTSRHDAFNFLNSFVAGFIRQFHSKES